MGNALDELGETYSGLGHLELARRLAPDQPNFHNDAGLVYRRIDDLKRASLCFADGLKLAPSDSNLLANMTATAIEAGDTDRAKAALLRLAQEYPDEPSLTPLRRALQRLLAERGIKLRLLPRVPLPEALGNISCTVCPVEIPLKEAEGTLCVGCGTEKHDRRNSCTFCGSRGVVGPFSETHSAIKFLCPFCREGSLKFEPYRSYA